MAIRLTFDDGPDPVWSPQVLDALDSADVRATFFVIGSLAQRHPDVVRETRARGHSIQPHCWAHDRTHYEMARREIRQDLGATLSALRSLGIDDTCYWRPPAGAVTSATQKVAAKHDLRVALWHVDPKDWRPEKTAAVMLEELRTEAVWRAGGDSIVLLHDGVLGTSRETAENTVAIIEPLTDYVRSRGWGLEVLRAPKPSRGVLEPPPLTRRMRTSVSDLWKLTRSRARPPTRGTGSGGLI